MSSTDIELVSEIGLHLHQHVSNYYHNKFNLNLNYGYAEWIHVPVTWKII